MNITEAQKKTVLKYIQDGQAMLDRGDANAIIDELFDISTMQLIETNGELTDEVVEVEHLMDDLVYQNPYKTP